MRMQMDDMLQAVPVSCFITARYAGPRCINPAWRWQARLKRAATRSFDAATYSAAEDATTPVVSVHDKRRRREPGSIFPGC